MQLILKKDQEYRIFITKQITDENEFMFPVYQRGLEALRSIVRQARKFSCDQDEIGLYGYCHNIIAFSGSRGQGKTSTMLSFSQALGNSFLNEKLSQDDDLAKCRFTVLPPIDPTVLEKDQSILAVILSRMYRLAEELWVNPRSGVDFFSDPSKGEAMRNQMLQLFQRCLSGINSIKFREGKEIRGLVEIHEISDSAVLKENICELITNLLRFSQRTNDRITPFLVIQLDDTDFQTRRCYEIMEDIRKYLTLPNVVILMATDLDMLRVALMQQSFSDFQCGVENNLINNDKLYKIESKYLDKLIPPNHVVYLPHLDEIIREENASLRIRHLVEDAAGKETDLLVPSASPWILYDFSFQEFIFRYVYLKTRIAFTPQRDRVHSILPTTLRGFSQFFVTISSMQDIPEVTEFSNPNELTEQIQCQLDVLDQNLSLFEDYFLNSWIHAKLDARKVGVIEALMTMEPGLWRQYASSQLKSIYRLSKQGDSFDKILEELQNDGKNLALCLQQWEILRLAPDTTYFIFAIRMFFDLHFHKSVAKQMRLAIETWKEKRGILLFDFSLDSTGISNVPPLSVCETAFRGIAQSLRQDQYDRIVKNIKDGKKYANLLLRQKDSQTYIFDPMSFVSFFLSLGSPDYKEMMSGETAQETLYLVQTTCAAIAVNGDIQAVIRRALEEWNVREEAELTYLEQLRRFFQRITDAIQSVNMDQACKAPAMILSWMQEIIVLMDEADNRSIFRNLLGRLKDELTQDHLGPLASIYSCAEKLDSAMCENSGDSEEIRNLWKILVDMSYPYSEPLMKDGIDLHALELLVEPESLEGDSLRPKSSAFWKEFDRAFGKVCKQLSYTKRHIQKKLKDEGKS